MNEHNPYAPPETRLGDQTSGLGPQHQLTTRMIDLLVATRPWVRFLSIVGFIGCGFMILAGFGLMAAGNVPEFQELESELGGVTSGVFGLFYIIMSVLYLIPSIMLFKFANAITGFQESPHAASMEAALQSQAGFWKFVGVLTLVGICLAFVAPVVVGILAAGIG